jgi:hypothetical protein
MSIVVRAPAVVLTPVVVRALAAAVLAAVRAAAAYVLAT